MPSIDPEPDEQIPDAVPDETGPEPSILGRVLLALGLMIGFYVLAIGIAVLMVWIPFAAAMGHITLPWKLMGFMIAGAGLILWSIVPRPDRFVPPGPRLDEKDQPKLFQVIREVAGQTEQEMPADVFLVLDMNAWVAQRGGIMGIGSSRVMGLGLPLLQYLTVPELKAVLAHEFGHYYGGDTKVGPWIYKTRAAIGRTVESLEANVSYLVKPFLAYGRMFLRVTHAVSRRQEYTADALAARTVGAEHLRDALLKIVAGSNAFRVYFEHELGPVLDAGYLPPVSEGFGHFVSCSNVSEWLTKGLESELESEESNPYLTHPPLPVRLHALGVTSSSTLPPDDGPHSITLLDRTWDLERDTLKFITNPESPGRLQRIAWNDVAPQILLPMWKRAVRQLEIELDGLTIGSLHALSTTPDALRIRFGYAPRSPEDVLRDDVGRHVCLAMQVALARHGWKIETAPGDPIVMVGPNGRLEAAQILRDLLFHKTDAGAWDRLCTEHGMAAIELGEGGECGDGEDLEVMYSREQIQIRTRDPKDTQRAANLVVKLFGRGGTGFSDRRLYRPGLTMGPFLWDAVRQHPAIAGLPSPAESKECPRCVLPLRLKRIDAARRPAGSRFDGVSTVTCATFSQANLSGATAVLSERYRGQGRIVPMMVREAHLRLIRERGPIEEPMFVLELGDRRLFLQFDGNAKLIYVDDYSPKAGVVPQQELLTNPG